MSRSVGTARSAIGRSSSTGSSLCAQSPAGDVPKQAMLALADRVRRWHELQRPRDIALEVEPGVVLERRWFPLETVGVYVPRNLVSTLVMCVVPAQVAGVSPHRRLHAAGRRRSRRRRCAAARTGGRVGARRSAGDRMPRVRGAGRQDRRPGQRHVNEAKLEVARDVAIDLPGGPSEVVVVGRTAIRWSSSWSSQRSRSTARIPFAARRDPRGGGDSSRRSTLCCSAMRSARSAGSETPERSSSAPGRRSPRATTRPAATTCCPRTAGRGRWAGSASRPS